MLSYIYDPVFFFHYTLRKNKDVFLFVRDGTSDDIDSRFKTVISLFNLSFEKKTIKDKPCFIFRFSKLGNEFFEKLSHERERSYLMFNNEFN